MSLPLQVSLQKGGKGLPSIEGATQVLEGTLIENISSGGCYFRISQELTVDSKVEMEIKLTGLPETPDGIAVRLRGKVVRVEQYPASGKFGVACTIDHYHWE